MLSLNEKNAIMKRFPEIELSYENLLHKKIYYIYNYGIFAANQQT